MSFSIPQFQNNEEIELIKKISKEMPRIRVLVISMDMQESVVYESIRAGAKGYLTKQDQGSDVLMAIYSLRNGYEYYNKSIFTSSNTTFFTLMVTLKN